MTAKVVATHIWPEHEQSPLVVDYLDCSFEGAVGDRHSGLTMAAGVRQKPVFTPGTIIRNHRQISIVDVGELNRIAEALGIEGIAPGVIADNICTQGLGHLTKLAPMTRLVFSGGAVLMLGGENIPCTIAGAMVERDYGSAAHKFPKAAIGLRGVTAWVERPGRICPADLIEVHPGR